MVPSILLVDDQRSILHLLHSTLNTMGHELEIIEAPSGEEALLSARRHHIDLLVADYLLPGINGIELVHKLRARHPEIKVILISGLPNRKAREEMLNAGAVAVFEKPISLADFLDAVERSLGLTRTIFPAESEGQSASRQSRLSDLLVNFRQDLDASAVFLLSDRGRVLARAGALRDGSMEVSLISTLMAIYSAGLKVSRLNHQEGVGNYHVFSGGDQDLIFIPVDVTYSLLLAGQGLASRARVIETVQAMLALKGHVETALKHLGMTAPLTPAEAVVPAAVPGNNGQARVEETPASKDMENLLDQAGSKKIKLEEMNKFWDQAAEKHGNASSNPNAISYEQARKLGLLPGEDT